jgi:hypothetical protein
MSRRRPKVGEPLFSLTRAGESATEAQERAYRENRGDPQKRFLIRRLLPRDVGETDTLEEAKRLAEGTANRSPVSVCYAIWDRNRNYYVGVFVRDGEWERHDDHK